MKSTPVFSQYFSKFFLFLIAVFLVFKVFFAYHEANGYPFGDWLINYQDGGFKRRGLLGTGVFFLYERFGINLKYSVFVLEFLFHFLFFFYLIKLLDLKKHSILEYVFLFTPFCLWGFISDNGMGARKDGVLWFLLSFFAYRCTKGKLTNLWWIFFSAAFFISVFIHESIVFFFPCFICLYLFHSPKIEVSKVVLIGLSFILPAVIVFFFGMKALGGTYTLEAIKATGIILQNSNIFTWKETELIKQGYYKQHLYDFSLYFISATLQFLFMIFYLFIKKFRHITIKKLVVAFAFCFLCSMPLFFIAIDIGRWLYNLFIFWAILIISVLPVKSDSQIGFNNKSVWSKSSLIFIFAMMISNFIYRAPSCFVGIRTAAPLNFVIRLLGF